MLRGACAKVAAVIRRDRIVKTFLDLVAIDSPSGEEDAIALELEGRLQALGLAASQDAHGNVIGRREGIGEPILLSAHMDTVEPGRGIRPVFDGGDVIRTDGTTILGADNKAGCAVILEVIQSVLEDGAAVRPIEVAISRGEEIGLVGAVNMDYSRISARVAIVIDSGGPPSSVQGSSPYSYGYTVEVYGKSAHAGLEPEKGRARHQHRRRGRTGAAPGAHRFRDHRERRADSRRHRSQRGARFLPG